jgi:endonuclease/exonuclease/phosphatase family metal-dependent hydrolase
LLCNLLITAGLLFSAWLPYLNPQRYWPSGFAGLFFLPCCCVNLSFIPLWLIWGKRYVSIPVAGLVLSLNALSISIGTHLLPDTPVSIPVNKQFTVMTFNTSNMGLNDYTEDTLLQATIYNTLLQASPDILCLQEFYTNEGPGFSNHIDSLKKMMGYPYHTFTCDKTHWDTWHYGIILFSRFPIVRASSIPCGFSPAGSGSSFLRADVLVYGDTLRVYTAQLKSYMFRNNDYELLEGGHGSYDAIRGLAARMKRTIQKRAVQAEQLAGLIAASPYKVIVCGDFNDTPVSYIYNTLSHNMQDAFLHRGRGIGRTLAFLAPTLRIDYILAQRPLQIHAYKTFNRRGFQHFPVMASLSL